MYCSNMFRHYFLPVVLALAVSPVAAVALENVPDDETISFWIGEGLREDPRVAAADILISTDEGVVTLSGTVRNLAERRYAGLIARKMQGVRSVVNRIEVFPVSRDDQDVAGDIRRRFAHSSPLRHCEIKVTVQQGAVTLTGTAESHGQKSEAELLASEVYGVRSVRNDLVIRYRQVRADASVRTDIEASLDRDVYLTGLPIDVRVDGGTVTLTGTVGNAYQRVRAEDECWKTSNVTDVINDLKVNWLHDRGERATAPSTTDQQLRMDVIADLVHDPRVDASGIQVTAERGHVTLRGTVPSLYQRQTAEQDAREVVGAVWVSNLLGVRAAVRPDSEIERDVKFEFEADYSLRHQSIQVRVIEGAVELTGAVSSYFVRSHASAVAGRVYGVRRVTNNLDVGWTPRFRDNALAQRVRTRLQANWETRWVADRIQVSVTNSVVTLTGDVDQWSERVEATRMAYLTDGVFAVENRLTVRGNQYGWEKWHTPRSQLFPLDPFPEYRLYFFEVPF